jgi:glutamate synthase (NADPH/NADH) small chain
MSKNIYQFIDVKRIDPPKKAIEQRKINFVVKIKAQVKPTAV